MNQSKRFVLLFFLMLPSIGTAAENDVPTDFEIPLDGGDSIPVTRYAAKGERLLLLTAGHRGLQEGDHALARGLAKRGVEVWTPDLLAARLLTPEVASLVQIPLSDIAAMLDAATATGKRIFLFTRNRGAALLFRGLAHWQAAGGDVARIGGLVFAHPYLYAGTPEPGQDATYVADVRDQFLPIGLVVPELAPSNFRMASRVEALQSGGAAIIVRRVPGVANGFWIRPDTTPAEDEAAKRFPELVASLLPLLEKVPRSKAPARFVIPDKPLSTSRQTRLQVFTGNPTPPPLALPDLDGKAQREAFKGDVVLINFWASWCSPCIEEMPSMQRLKERLTDRPFRIVAVNIGRETPDTVYGFMKKTGRLDFNFLMDEDGIVTKDWKVFAYPTSYLVDAQGTIRYAVTGALDWGDPEVVQIVESLLPPTP